MQPNQPPLFWDSVHEIWNVVEGFASIQTGALLRSDSGSEAWLTFGFQLIPKESDGSVWIGTLLPGQTLKKTFARLHCGFVTLQEETAEPTQLLQNWKQIIV